MKYYKQLNENGEIVALLSYDFEPKITDAHTVEITAEEYEAERSECAKKAKEKAAERRAKIVE